MLRRESLYTLALALCVVAPACGDDEEREMDAGASGAGGDAAEAGSGGDGGTGGRQAIYCAPQAFSLDAWCELERKDCGRSQSEWLSDLCEARRTCASSLQCTRITLRPNSCGGSSIVATYGVDVETVTHHYNAAGELLGVVDNQHRCPPQQGQHYYGEQCSVGTPDSVICPDLDADGGSDDGGI